MQGQLPLPPPSAQRSALVCHHCIVGCGYHVYRWPFGSEGGPAPHENALGLDFRQQLPALAGAPVASMYGAITNHDGAQFHTLTLPDRECLVNRGLYSTRGGQHGALLYAAEAPTAVRLHHPERLYDEGRIAISWEQAFDLFGRVAVATLEGGGADALLFNCFDHGGGGGGFENTWGTGKLMFKAIGSRMVRIHNRPAYNSECHASRDMGVGELNNCYQDAQLADTLLVCGANPYETQTNYFLAHWLPNLRGESAASKRAQWPGEAVEPTRIIIIDPRRTPTVAICQQVAGDERVLHLDLIPGTDTALFNGLLTYALAQGWEDRAFINDHTQGFAEMAAANRLSLERCSEITGLPVEKIRRAAQWAYQPKADGSRRRTLHAYEKGLIWGNDNYRTQAALVDLALATGNVGRAGGGVVRLGGHQEGYARPPYPGPRPAPNVDRAVIDGAGRMLTIWGTNPFQSSANAATLERAVRERGQIVSAALRRQRHATGAELAAAVAEATAQGGLFVTVVDLYATRTAQAAHLLLPAAQVGEMNLTSMNGERRLRLSERFMDPPGVATPDCLIAAGMAKRIRALYQERGDETMAQRFAGFEWQSEEAAFDDGFRHPEGIDSQGGANGALATYERLRAAGNNGVQLPIQGYQEGRLIGTERLYSDGHFDTPDGRAQFLPAPWDGWLAEAAAQRERYPFWVNNGRVNHLWQTGYHDRLLPFRATRFPLPPLEVNPADAERLGIAAGDLVELANDYGTMLALAYPEPDAKPGQLFVQFGHFASPVGRLVSEAVDRNVVPYYKGVWAELRRVEVAPAYATRISFKSRRYRTA